MKINALPIGICNRIIFLYQFIPECYLLMRLILTIPEFLGIGCLALGHNPLGFTLILSSTSDLTVTN